MERTEFEHVCFLLRVDPNLQGYDVQENKQDVEKAGCLSKNTDKHGECPIYLKS